MDNAAVPRLPGVEHYLAEGCVPGGTLRNFDAYGHKLPEIDERTRNILCDPQTSGGLLVACAPVVAVAHEIAAGSAFALSADLALVDQLRDQALCRASRNVGVSREEFCQCQSFDG